MLSGEEICSLEKRYALWRRDMLSVEEICSLEKRYALWRRDTVEFWNPWWCQVLNSSKTDSIFGYFSWTKAKRSAVWEHFEQGADIQNDSPKALCKACWKVFAHPELQSGGSSTSTLWRHYEHKKCGGSKSRQTLLLQFEVVS
jgi:hypothetical protein